MKEEPLFRLPQMSEAGLRRRYRLPSTTKVYRNLAIRHLRKNKNPETGVQWTAKEILSLPFCVGLNNVQSVYQIERSRAFQTMEEDLAKGVIA